ncbi:MAG: hypothetical protein DMG67_08725 [Acidobacteria bacterium]|nr:MAG: hypothetical protein DMG67_08725 [Acidobacteriota bacterium]
MWRPSVAKGIPQQFAALGTYSDSSTHNVTTLAGWTSSNMNIATIGAATGLAQTLGVGNSTITSTLGAVTPSSTTLTVIAPVVVAVVVTPQKVSPLPGATVPYVAMAAFSDHTSQNVTTNQAVWSSSNTNAATIGTSTGIATAIQGTGGGVTSISAVFGGKTGSATLTLPALTSIPVTPANQIISPGTTLQFTATGTYSDGRTQILTNVVNWSSDNAVVTINPSTGLATGNMTATLVTANIKATLGTLSGTTKLSVGAQCNRNLLRNYKR